MTRHRQGITAIGLIILAAILAAIMMLAVLIYKLATDSYSVPGQYKYDLSAHEKTDPKLVLFSLEKVIDLKAITQGQGAPVALAVGPDGRIYIALDYLVMICAPGGSVQRVLMTGQIPTALGVGGDGTIYVGAGSGVFTFHPDAPSAPPLVAGDPTTASAPAATPTPAPAKPWYKLLGSADYYSYVARDRPVGSPGNASSIVASGENVFVADSAGRVVHRLTRTGGEIGLIDGKGRGKAEDSDAKGFVIPSPYFALAVAPDGLLRIVNPGRHRVETYTFDGELEVLWGRQGVDIEGFSGCCNPVSIAIFPDGRFVTAEKGLMRVKLYSPEGKFLGVVAGPEDFVVNHADAYQVCQTAGEKCATGGLDVAATKDGKVLVLDPAGRTVRVYAPKDATVGQPSKAVQSTVCPDRLGSLSYATVQ